MIQPFTCCFSVVRLSLAIGALVLASCQPAAHHTARHRRDLLEEADEERQTDRPDLAEAQEAALTRDPTTGTVPRERLLQAKDQMDVLFKARAAAQQRATTTGGSLSAANWTEKGPSNIAGRVLALLPDPSDATGNQVWAAAASGGLWKSNNAASTTPTWNKVNDTFANLAISTLAADPTNPDVLYFGTGEGFANSDASRGLGIWKSTDHGLTWTQLGSTNNSLFYYVQKITVDKNGWVYAATRTGLRRSKDGGSSWGDSAFNNAAGYGLVCDVEVNPLTGTVYVSLGINQLGGIWRSATGDPGTFVQLTSGLPPAGATTRIEMALAPSNPAQLYALFCSSGRNTPSGSPVRPYNTLYDIYRSADGGDTWQVLPRPVDSDLDIADDFTRGQAWYDLAISVSPTDPATVFIGGIDLFKTSNGTTATATNVAWQQVTRWNTAGAAGTATQNVHADQHAIAFVPGSGSRVFFGNDGGVATTATATDPIPAVTPINTTLNITQFYAVAVHPTDINYFIAGAQDNGTQQFRGVSGSVTRDVNGGDGAFCAIDQYQPDVQFATYVYCNIYRSNAKGDDFFPDVVEESSNFGSFINPLEYDSQNKGLYYNYSTASVPALRRALNANVGAPTLSTIALPSLAAGTIITHVAVSPNVNDRVYVGTNQGQVLQLDNASGASPTITTIFTGVANTSVSSIGVEQLVPGAANPDQHLLVTIANYGTVSIYQTTNGGTNWTSAEGNLPDMPVRWVLPDPTGGKRALIATELGVWTTDDLYAAAVVWAPANSNFANVRVDMLRVRKSDRTVVAATHGRGLFTSDILIANPLPVELTAFTATPGGINAVRLAWSTASEKNSARFEVERSRDGTHFEYLGAVVAAGSSSSPQHYGLTDAALPVAPSLYYRLRQVDTDGAFSYSPVRVVARLETTTTLAVFPNPTRGAATLTGATAGTSVRVLNALGKVLFSATADEQGRANVVPEGNLPAGVYVVRAGSRSTRFVVE